MYTIYIFSPSRINFVIFFLASFMSLSLSLYRVHSIQLLISTSLKFVAVTCTTYDLLCVDRKPSIVRLFRDSNISASHSLISTTRNSN